MNKNVMDILYQTDLQGYILKLKQELADARAEIKDQDAMIIKLTHDLAKLKGSN
jgi:hypothetical protein